MLLYYKMYALTAADLDVKIQDVGWRRITRFTRGLSMEKGSGSSFMQKVAAVIVERKTVFFLLFTVLAVFCFFSRNWVNVNDDITSYLGKDTETRRGLDIMETEFTTFATANVMVSSITYEAAERLLPQIDAINGVHSVELDATEAHYKNASALFTVTFDGDTTSPVSEGAMDEIKVLLSDYDTYISSDVGNPMEQTVIMGLPDGLTSDGFYDRLTVEFDGREGIRN